MSAPDKPFFVGYLPAPPALRRFLALAIVCLIAGFAVVGWVIGTTQADPGPGAFRFDYGQQTVVGVLSQRPYPVVHVVRGNERLPAGHSVMLTGQGKNGVMDRTARYEGRMVMVSGVVLERGALDMLQLRGGMAGLREAGGRSRAVAEEDLGRWRLAGELCDGKCLAGAMRPGRGLAHKACANLCVIGGIPPVFVSSQPVEGSEFLLVGGPDGGPIPDEFYDLMAVYISVEGQLIRRGDMLVFLIDPETAEVL